MFYLSESQLENMQFGLGTLQCYQDLPSKSWLLSIFMAKQKIYTSDCGRPFTQRM